MLRNANSTTEESAKSTASAWSDRCAALFDDLRKPARAMVSRAYRGLSDEEIDDIYASAWTSSLAALRGRESQLDDEELRKYLLAAVAGHASKEMRRRSRRATSSLDDQGVSDPIDIHQATTDERVLEREDGAIARDLLSSLPERRRAVMLLRFGWGMKPKEVCALVEGLSPRAYRKEINRGVDELIDRFGQIESGEWCRSRRALLRDHIAGTADEDSERQAREHLAHCLPCRSLVNGLGADLRALDGVGLVAATGMASLKASPLDRAGEAFDRARDAVSDLVGRGGSQVAESLGPSALSGGTRGAGTVGAGALAKFAGLGLAGKTAIACLGAGAAATACVAAGILPSPLIPLRTAGDDEKRPPRIEVVDDQPTTASVPIDGELTPSSGLDDYAPPPPAPSPEPAPEPSPAPAPEPVDPIVREFDPLSPVTTTSTATSPSPTSPATGGGGDGSGDTAAQQEFGP